MTKRVNKWEQWKKRLYGNQTAKILSLLAALVMPVYLCATGFITDMPLSPFELTCFGFYGCIFLCLAWEKKWLGLKIVFVIINTLINGFYILLAFLGGVTGPLLVLLQMIIPIPWYKIFG